MALGPELLRFVWHDRERLCLFREKKREATKDGSASNGSGNIYNDGERDAWSF